jgi:aminoglycoside phosphotransferase family enzyme
MQEVELNSSLALHVYLGVAPVLLFPDGQSRFGPTLPTNHVPLPEKQFNL